MNLRDGDARARHRNAGAGDGGSDRPRAFARKIVEFLAGQPVCRRAETAVALDGNATATAAFVEVDLAVVDATAALLPGRVPKKEVDARRRELLRIQRDISKKKLRALRGKTLEVLVEGASDESEYLLMGRHDFASLASAGSDVKTTERTVTRSQATCSGETLVYEVEADGFLRTMVRSMVGGLLAAGRGTVGVEALREALLARDRRAWPAPAPACGLCLVSVRYPGDDTR